MPKGDSNAIFDSGGIFIVGTCPPMKMDTNLLIDSLTAVPKGTADFLFTKILYTKPLIFHKEMAIIYLALRNIEC